MNIAILGEPQQNTASIVQICQQVDEKAATEFYMGCSLLQAIADGEMYNLIFVDIDSVSSGGISLIPKLASVLPSALIVAISRYNLCINNLVEYIWKFCIRPISVAEIKSILNQAKRQLSAQLLYLPTGAGKEHIVLNIHSIVFFEMFDKQGVVHTTDKKEVQFKTPLIAIEKSIDQTLFFKPHKSYLINIEHIRYITETNVYVFNEEIIPLSRNRKNQVYKLLSAHPEIIFL